MGRTRGSLGEVIDRMLESERRAPAPTPVQANDVIRALLGAIDNLDRARERRAAAAGDHLAWRRASEHQTGCEARLANARRAAEEFLKPGASALC